MSVNSDNCNNVTGSTISGNVKYDVASNTVTLNNVAISRTGSDNRAIFNESNAGLTVKLVGDNYLSATDAAPVRFQRASKMIVIGRTQITGGSEGGIYITGGYTLDIEGPGTLLINATSKGGIEGSSDNNFLTFCNISAEIYGGGGDLLDIYSVTFKGSASPTNAPKDITLKSISASKPNVKNVTTMP